MAYLKAAKTPDEIKKTPVSQLRKDYESLAKEYNDLIDGRYVYCNHCGKFLSRDSFYGNKDRANGLEIFACKKCLLIMATDKGKDDTRVDNKEKAIWVLQRLDLPFIESAYNNAVKDCSEGISEKNRSAGWLQYMTMLLSLPNWRGQKWEHSQFDMVDDANPDYEQKEIKKVIQSGRKRFGLDYSNSDIMFLEQEYKDWITRYECNTKAQEEIFKNLATNRLERKQAVKAGKPTKEIDKTFQELLATQNIQPRQTGMDTFADAQTFGTLLQKWEETRPLPEIDESLRDVDKIGLYLDTFYKGNILKCLDLKNPLHHLYEKIIKLFSVDKPEYKEDEDTSTLFDFIFGKDEDI